MIDPALKTALAVCVVLGGVCAAMLFRHDQPRLTAPDISSEETLLLRCRTKVAERNRQPPHRSASVRGIAGQPPSTPASPMIVVKPLDRHEPPPSLAAAYPEAAGQVGLGEARSSWGASMEMMLPVAEASADAKRVHRVVDGDTLAGLAARYLGSAARAEEIYAANRDILNDPELLPIGAELKLPQRGETVSASERPTAAGMP
jgi:nucleoid-associated protein YgaU